MLSRLQKGHKSIISCAVLLLLLGSIVAQNGNNPFELVPRAGTKETKKNTAEIDQEIAVNPPDQTDLSENPFALSPPARNPEKARKKRTFKPDDNPVTAITEDANQDNIQPKTIEVRTKRFIFSIVILDLILVAIVMTLLRNFFQKSYNSFINDNLLSQIFRERQAGTLIPFLIFYVLFFYNLALFSFLLINHYELPLSMPPLTTFFYLLFGVSLVFFGKHLLLRIVGYIFPVDQELRKYSFTIMIFAIITGFFLLLVNLLIAYGPDNMTKYVIYISLIIIGIIYLFRSLRGLFIANKYLWFHKFHFLLYICTVEIAPAIIMLKLILKQL